MTGLGAAFLAECRDLARHPLTWIGALAVAIAAYTMGVNAPLKDNGYVVYESAHFFTHGIGVFWNLEIDHAFPQFISVL